MPKIINSGTPYADQPCPRCGSMRRILRTWKEKLPTLTGTTAVEYSQIVCTNDVCQIAFDKHLLVETKKKEAVRIKRGMNEAARKANSLLQASKTRKNKSRI